MLTRVVPCCRDDPRGIPMCAWFQDWAVQTTDYTTHNGGLGLEIPQDIVRLIQSFNTWWWEALAENANYYVISKGTESCVTCSNRYGDDDDCYPVVDLKEPLQPGYSYEISMLVRFFFFFFLVKAF